VQLPTGGQLAHPYKLRAVKRKLLMQIARPADGE